MYELENRLITLNSDYGTRLNGNYLSSMIFNFSGLLKQDASIISSNVCAINAQFAVSWYIINESNNILYYTLDETTFKSITISPANYNANSLFTAIVTALNANGDGGFVFTLFQPTGIITATNSYVFRFLPYSPLHPSTLSRVLGITTGYYDYKFVLRYWNSSTQLNNYVDYTISLPITSYTLSTLSTTIDGLLVAQNIQAEMAFIGSQLRLTCQVTGAVIAMLYLPTNISGFFGINADQNPLFRQFYTPDPNLLNDTIDSLVLTQVADTPLNLLGVKKLSVKSSLLGISSYTSESGGKSITLTTIPADKAPFTMISYENKSDLNKQTLGIDIIDSIDIQIVDERDNFINFNNVGWTITLVLESIRRKKENIGTFRELLS
jgi:hypothetical protein